MDDVFEKLYELVKKTGFYNVMGKAENFVIKKAIQDTKSFAAAGRKISMERTTFSERVKRYGIKKHEQESL